MFLALASLVFCQMATYSGWKVMVKTVECRNISLSVIDMALYTAEDWLELDSVSEIIKWTFDTNPGKS